MRPEICVLHVLSKQKKIWHKLGSYALAAVQINQQKLYANGWFTMALVYSCSVNKPTEALGKWVDGSRWLWFNVVRYGHRRDS